MAWNALVTGAHGLVGSWLARALLAEGHAVVALERDAVPGSPLELDGTRARCAVVHGDVTDRATVERAIAEYEIDTVFHLAAQTIVGVARRAPLGTWETNVRGTWLVLEAARTAGVARVVVASSDKAYGAAGGAPYREDMPLEARFPYDASKAAADLIARSYWHSYGLPVAVTRLANVYGGGDRNPSRLVPEAVAAVLAGRRPVIRSDGSPQRDLLHVEDAARAYLALAHALDGEGARGEALNAGTGVAHSVLDVVRRVCRLAGTDLEPDVRGAGTPAGEIDRQVVDASRLRALTGWAPEIDLDEGLRRTIAWHRAH